MSEHQSPDRYRKLTIYCGVYLALIGVQVVLSIVLAGSDALIGLARTALVAMLFPALVLLPITLLMRRWRLAGIMLLPVIALVMIYAPYFVPREQTPPSDDDRVLTVMTLNLHQAQGEEAETLAALIREVDADIVALQELGPAPRDNFGPMVEDTYPYQALYGDDQYLGSGQGILSKYPILEEEYWKAGGPWNGHLRVALDVDGQQVIVYNAHPHPPIESGLKPEMQSHYDTLHEVLDRANADDGAVLIMGDFNMTQQFAIYRDITANFSDAWRSVGGIGPGFTHMAPIPFWRIDYVFYNAQFRGIDARMLPATGATDHLPLVVRVELVEP